MSILKLTHHRLNLFICRYQSQKFFDLLNRKTSIEIETNDQLENLPCENTIEWNKKLKSYRINGEGKKALKLFEIGLRKHQFQPDYITYISMLELCKDIKDVDSGRYIHRHILTTPVRDNSRIQTLLMDVYIKGGDMESAREMFNILKHRTVVELNSLMTAYNANHLPQCTIDLFHDIRDKYQIKSNTVSNILYIQACIMMKSFELGKILHENIKQKTPNYFKNKELANQIIAMYIALGDYSQAEDIFKQIKEATLQNYIGLMNYYNQSKNYERTFQLYEQLKLQRKIQADPSVYLAILTAIKHSQQYERLKQIEEDLIKQNLWQNHFEIQNFIKQISK